ncbi:CRISPR system precrRNA processing endoribonuclease RAMP protein Cas6, partial [candidate division KSB1 bacterium]|nr:CRISPR system precrRNA processing endoribonuclease RAMP protein Cas6 [candidate division KSB1 bacterium]
EIRNDTKIIDEKQYSPTSGTLKMFLGGYLGKIVYQGDLSQFWPWLKVGELIHVGKNCAFGLGKFTVSGIETTT